MPKIAIRTAGTSLVYLALAACGGSEPNTANTETVETAVATSPAATLVMACSGCHSAQNGAIAALDLYSEPMLRDAMLRYKNETDGTTVMHRLARGYSDAEIDLISTYLSQDGATP